MIQHKKILTRQDKTKLKIIVRFSADSFREGLTYNTYVHILPPNKRKWQDIINDNDFEYRVLSLKDRGEYTYREILKYVTPEEILQAKLELWEKLKPE